MAVQVAVCPYWHLRPIYASAGALFFSYFKKAHTDPGGSGPHTTQKVAVGDSGLARVCSYYRKNGYQKRLVLNISRLTSLAVLRLICVQIARAQEEPSDRPMNVLFIAVDDLRPAGESYGVPEILARNIDRLASGGTVFTRAYVQQAFAPTRGMAP